ncbi:hypothetical protein BGZ47_001908 [Haplosporangium gracile]|nr:hypothetical protein BGZ47_001908 [Haplosporangium gracile]
MKASVSWLWIPQLNSAHPETVIKPSSTHRTHIDTSPKDTAFMRGFRSTEEQIVAATTPVSIKLRVMMPRAWKETLCGTTIPPQLEETSEPAPPAANIQSNNNQRPKATIPNNPRRLEEDISDVYNSLAHSPRRQRRRGDSIGRDVQRTESSFSQEQEQEQEQDRIRLELNSLARERSCQMTFASKAIATNDFNSINPSR